MASFHNTPFEFVDYDKASKFIIQSAYSLILSVAHLFSIVYIRGGGGGLYHQGQNIVSFHPEYDPEVHYTCSDQV